MVVGREAGESVDIRCADCRNFRARTVVPDEARGVFTGLISQHLTVRGENTHHMIEACFKGVGRALRPALCREGRELPTTKGLL